MEEVCLIIIFDSTSSAFYFYFICLVLRTAVFLFFFRSVFHSIFGLSLCLWHSSFSYGDFSGSVHQPRVCHLLEEDLPTI